MAEPRSVIGGALLATPVPCWIAGASLVATDQKHWTDWGVLGLLAAGGAAFVLGILVLTWPTWMRRHIAAEEIHTELQGILGLLRIKLSVIERGQAAEHGGTGFRLKTPQWHRHREALASHPAYESTATAYQQIDRLNEEIAWQGRKAEKGQKYGFGPSHDLPGACAAIEDALRELEHR
jgi:hypothetical protein